MTTIVWFRQDLRRKDNPALADAAARGAVIPLFILDEETPALRALGGASRWWLHHSLAALAGELGGLVLRRGAAEKVLSDLIAETGATAIVWNRVYDGGGVARDKALKANLGARGIDVRSFNAALLHEPWELTTQSGEPYKVFTPFWRAARQRGASAPVQTPKAKLAKLPKSDQLDDWALKPTKPDWAAGWETIWSPGEAGAAKQLAAFLRQRLKGYGEGRDFPDQTHTSRLSPHLHWGEISPRQVWSALAHADAANPALARDGEKFLSELGWREFAHHLLFHFPEMAEKNWRSSFDAFPWRRSAKDFAAWSRGQTGYPLVDAGMRELWATGYMHNRVRMVTASFLIKHLRLDWRKGEAWFWDTLVDADHANNPVSWQWVAGSGADAAPYFRIFNPTEQGRKFDASGAYIRRWVPELAKLPGDQIHAPFDAGDDALRAANVRLGETYPAPIVDHRAAREAALAAYAEIKAR